MAPKTPPKAITLWTLVGGLLGYTTLQGVETYVEPAKRLILEPSVSEHVLKDGTRCAVARRFASVAIQCEFKSVLTTSPQPTTGARLL